MKIIDYFSGIKDIGSLDIEKILCEYDFPLLFTLINNKTKDRYIAVCCDVVHEQRWIIAPISIENIIKLLKDQIDIYSSFRTNINGKCIIAHWKRSEGMRYEYVACSEIPDEELPLKGDYLEAYDDEFEEYIKELQESELVVINCNYIITPISNSNRVVAYCNHIGLRIKSFIICEVLAKNFMGFCCEYKSGLINTKLFTLNKSFFSKNEKLYNINF